MELSCNIIKINPEYYREKKGFFAATPNIARKKKF